MAAFARIWKLVVLVAAALAALACFAPYIEQRIGDGSVRVSAYRVLFGFDDIGQFAPRLRALPDAERVAVLDQLNRALGGDEIQYGLLDPPHRHSSRGPYFFFGPALLLLVVASVAICRRELGMLGALFAIGGGLAAVYGLLRPLVIGLHTAQSGQVAAHVVWGAYLLAAAGVLAGLGGVAAMVWPDPGGFRARPTISARRGLDAIRLKMPDRKAGESVPTATLRPPRRTSTDRR